MYKQINAKWQKGLTKLGKNMKSKEYNPENLQHLAKFVKQAISPMERWTNLPTMRINLEGFQKAIKSLPEKQRKSIEVFWGLNGGPNHSKKMVSFGKKDIAFMNMCNSALLSMRLLYKLDYLIFYDDNLHLILDMLDSKINKNDLEDMSQLDRIKYLIIFFLYVANGPRIYGEDDLLNINTKKEITGFLDEYLMMKDLINELEGTSENSVNIALLKKMLDMFDLRDMLVIKKRLGLEIAKEDKPEKSEILQSIFQIRSFKEEVFKYGAWNVTTELIMGKSIDLNTFMKEAHKISRKKSKIESFKTGERTLRTSREVRVLDVYSIGGLEFTDPYEIGFLYVERSFIENMLNG